jgi:hypothetical protein
MTDKVDSRVKWNLPLVQIDAHWDKILNAFEKWNRCNRNDQINWGFDLNG